MVGCVVYYFGRGGGGLCVVFVSEFGSLMIQVRIMGGGGGRINIRWIDKLNVRYLFKKNRRQHRGLDQIWPSMTNGS